MGVLDTLAAATPMRRTVAVHTDGALQSRWDQLLLELDQATNDAQRHASLADPTGKTGTVDDDLQAHVDRNAAEMDEIRDKVAASRVVFTIEQMPWTDRVTLQSQHPPRKGNLADAYRGYNTATFPKALIIASTVLVVDANGDEATEIPAATWDHLLGTPAVEATDTTDATPATRGSLNFKAVNDLTTAATSVNDGETTVPPSARSLLGNQASGASSTPPKPGTSPRSGSAGGSRRSSPKSSATKKATSTRDRSPAT